MEGHRGSDTIEDLSCLWGDLRLAAQRRGLDFHSSEDVVQESWLRTLQRGALHELKLRGWLSVVSARLAGKHRMGQLRRWARERAVARSEAVEQPHGWNEGSFLLRCVNELPEPYGPVIRMRYLEDREVEEIATRLHRSAGTVRSQIQRGVRRLRVRLQEGDPRRASSLCVVALRRKHRSPSSRILPASGVRFAIVAAASVLLIVGLYSLLPPDSGNRSETRLSSILPPVYAPATELSKPMRSVRQPETGAVAAETHTGAVVAGTVRAPGGEPVAGAEVFAGRWDGADARRVAVTDESGRFGVSDLGPNAFLWGTAGAWFGSPRRYVATLAAPGACDLVLTGTGEQLTVLVRAADAEPVVGARVELAVATRLRTQSWLSIQGTLEVASPVTGITDESGIAVLPRPPAGPFRVIVKAEGHPTLDEKMSLPEDCDRKEVVLAEPTAIAGRVVDEGGQPAWKASVEVLQPSQPVRRTCTAPDGTFEITGLRPGSFSLRAAEDPSLGTASCFREGAAVVGADATFELRLSRESTIRGRASHGASLAGGRARITTKGRRDEWIERTTLIGTDGEFAFPGCPGRAPHRLEVFAPGSSVPWGWLSEAETNSGEDNLVLPAALGSPLVVEFDCADPRFLPVVVELRQSFPCFSVTAPVDPETARATFPALPMMSYLAIALVPGLGSWRAGRVEVSGTSRVQRIRVQEPARVSGELHLPHDAGLESVSGWVANPDGFGWGRNLKQELAVDRDGRFVVELFPGEYDFVFECRGFAGERRRVRVDEGLDQHMTIEPVVGIPVRLRLLLPRRLEPGEGCRLEAQVAGRWQLDLGPSIVAGEPSTGTDLHARVSIPARASELRIVTNAGLEGSTLLDPAWALEPMPEIEIELREPPH